MEKARRTFKKVCGCGGEYVQNIKHQVLHQHTSLHIVGISVQFCQQTVSFHANVGGCVRESH
jgi:hypothetical protein